MNILRLKEIREDRDFKQSEIAKLLKVTQVQYCRYELGVNYLPIDKLNKLADFYNTSTDYSLYRIDERKQYSKSIMYNTIVKKEHIRDYI